MIFWESMKSELLIKGKISNLEMRPLIASSNLVPPGHGKTDSFRVVKSYLNNFDLKQPDGDALARMTYLEFKLRLPELLLMRVDKITMSESLEARVPFLDHPLLEFSLDVPQSLKIKGGEPKYLLKKGVKDLIPEDMIYRKKMGFGAPMSDWLRGGFGEYVTERINASSLMTRQFFNAAYIDKLIEDHRSGSKDNGYYIWTIFNLTEWYDHWIAPE